ncbi:hypothetical protein [Neolewinella antarctica]|uniref:Uncharacterized protein n=1 Tax=Neolewinella antarctica TaxID=442734 RepID=A0ABX0XC87_9BACT|nr:hypothetical protein [Neolewinella antarctica]NJC26865.1 hypothetical protein [Neolewinella antarctica]
MNLQQLQNMDASVWADHFVEPHTEALFRRDLRGNWYDVEGVRLTIPIFLRGDVLVNLPGKVARRSYGFRGQELLVSPGYTLIQIGRQVLNGQLEAVRYFGERLAGLGPGYVKFSGGEAWQEVLLGLSRRAFINETDYRPLLINGEEIVRHAGTELHGGHRYEVFQSATRFYVLRGGSDELVTVNGAPADIGFNTYLRFGEYELARAFQQRTRTDGKSVGDERDEPVPSNQGFYVNLLTGEPFRVAALGDVPILGLAELDVPGKSLYQIQTAEGAFVFDAKTDDLLTIDNGLLQPESLHVHPTFPHLFYTITVAGQEVICDQRTGTSLALGEEGLRVSKITGQPEDRLLNARTSRGAALVLDTIDGLDELRPATTDGRRIVETLGNPHRISGLTLQPALVQRLGGPVPRVLVISDSELPIFTLPTDLLAYDDQTKASAHAGAEIVSVDFTTKVLAGKEAYYRAKFLTYQGAEESVLLDASNGRPLHLEGAGHRNELVTGLVESSLTNAHFLGEHQMIGAHTLTEDQKESEVLFSLRNNRSWLPFYDGFLPIFRRTVQPTNAEQDWHYDLFELRESSGSGEYVAVEKKAPHRLLAQRVDGKLVPKIITTKDRSLINPEEVSQWRKIFADAGVLVEVI